MAYCRFDSILRKDGPMRDLRDFLSLDDFEPVARGFLPRPLFGYISGGVETDA